MPKDKCANPTLRSGQVVLTGLVPPKLITTSGVLSSASFGASAEYFYHRGKEDAEVSQRDSNGRLCIVFTYPFASFVRFSFVGFAVTKKWRMEDGELKIRQHIY